MYQVKREAIDQLYASLTEESTFDLNFALLSISACLIATFGLISNSAAVIIGAMIVAPLMMPIRGLAFSAMEGNLKLFKLSFNTLFLGTILSIAIAALIGYTVGLPTFGSEVLARTTPNLIDLGVALAAGVISAFAKVQPKINDAVAGTAIAVALMPPLCTVGLTLSNGSFNLSLGAYLLFLTNLLGIAFACMLVFRLMGYHDQRSKSRYAFGLTMVLIGFLIIPLGISFWQLIKQAQIEYSISNLLRTRTVTVGQKVTLLKTQVDWGKKPPTVTLDVRLKDAEITPFQVKLVEEYLAKQMGERFTLIIYVSDIKEIRAN